MEQIPILLTLFTKVLKCNHFFLRNSTIAERRLEMSKNNLAGKSKHLLAPTNSPMYHCGSISNMAASQKLPLANLFEQQDKETLLETSLSTSGSTKFKGSESSALSLLNKLRFEGEAGFCDVTLAVEGKVLTSHRCVLAASSQFFYTMFNSGMKESNQKVLNLQSVTFNAMSVMLDYFYSREIVINDENVLDLLNAASFLLVTPVKNACLQLLSKRLNIENCFSVLQVAEQFGAQQLAQRANSYIKTNFSVAVKSEEFIGIPEQVLVGFITLDDIQVEKEEEVYCAVMKWVKHDPENRAPVLPKLLECLRTGSLPKRFLELQMTQEPLLNGVSNQSKPVKRRYKRRNKWGKPRKAKAVSEKLDLQKIRPSTEVHNVIIGVNNFHRAFCYDLDNKETLILPEPWPQFYPQVAIVGRRLYLVAGFTSGFTETIRRVSCLCFDDIKNLRSSSNFGVQPIEWKMKTAFNDARIKASLQELNGRLYYIGGHDGRDCCGTVECYDPELDQWHYCASLIKSRCKSGCVTANGHIYIIGGQSGSLLADLADDSPLSSVEKYDAFEDSWSLVAPMKEGRSEPGCVFHHNKIFVVGGLVSNGCQTRNCEVYSPLTDEWNTIAQLPYSYCGVNNVIIIKNQVTIPLTGEASDFCCDALKYSQTSNSWQKVKNLFPSDKIVWYTLCTTQLPMLILKRMYHEIFPEDFFDDRNDSDDDDDYFESSDNSSYLGWHWPLHDSDHFEFEPSDDDALYF